MKKILLVMAIFLSGCSTIDMIKEYWPRSHDSDMFAQLIRIEVSIENIDCEKPDWSRASDKAYYLMKYTEYRRDPQRVNIKGLYEHTIKMSKSTNKTFCELGKKTAKGRIDVTRKVWEGR